MSDREAEAKVIHDPRKEQMDPEWEKQHFLEALKSTGEFDRNAIERAGKPAPELTRPDKIKDFVENLDPERIGKEVVRNRRESDKNPREFVDHLDPKELVEKAMKKKEERDKAAREEEAEAQSA